MPTKSELTEQTELAFDFILKLYLETSYLIKEVEASGVITSRGITFTVLITQENNKVDKYLIDAFEATGV